MKIYYLFQTPYETTVPEDTPVGSTIFSNIMVEDADLLGETLEVTCTEHPQVNHYKQLCK